MKNKRKKLTVVTLCIMLVGLSILVNARSATATLFSDEYSKSTAAVGNSSGGFYWWGSVGTTSMYNVTYAVYGGANSSNCTNKIGSWAKAPGTSFIPSKAASSHGVGILTMYGNTENNQKRDCIASGGINDTN